MAALGSSEARRYGLVKDGYKFVVTERDGVWNGRLSRMGREDVDLSAAAPQIARELRLRLVEMRSEVDRGVPESRQELSAEDIETLRALGYGEPAE